MESNMYSTEEASPAVEPVGLRQLKAAVDELATQNLHALPDAEAAARVLALRRLVDRLEGQFLRELAGVDGRGAAGAETDDDQPALSTASWLRTQLRLSKGAARHAVHTARALYRGPLTGTAQALTAGELSAAHAGVLAAGTADLPAATAAEAEPVLLEAARRLDPPRLRRAVAHLRHVIDPDGAEAEAQRRFERRGLWLSPTWEGMLAVDGLLDPEAGQTLLAALDPLARPTGADDERSGTQRNADALAELARRSLEGGRLPQSGGVRPQLLVTVDLDSLLGRHGSPAGELGWVGSLGGAAARRLACDGALTRVLVTRHPTQQPSHQPDRHHPNSHHHPEHGGDHATSNGSGWQDTGDGHHHDHPGDRATSNGDSGDDTGGGHHHDHHGGGQRADGGGWQNTSGDLAGDHQRSGWDDATSDPGWNSDGSNGGTDSTAGWNGAGSNASTDRTAGWNGAGSNASTDRTAGWNGAGSNASTDSTAGWNGAGSNASTDRTAGWNGGNGGGAAGLAARLRAALSLLPVALGGAPTQPLELGRTTRVVAPAQRNALIVRDGGCVFPDCGRPQTWCEAHHLTHWLHGGPTDLGNLALLCRAHHRAVHEGGWRLHRDPDGHVTATPPNRP